MAGFGDDFMLARAAPTPLPEHVRRDIGRSGPAPPPPGAATRLELTPARGVAQREQPIRYTAVAVDANGRRSDFTALTNFRFKDAAPCRKVEIGTVVWDQEGTYHLTGEVDVPRLTSDEVELEVTYDPVPPRIESVDRDRSPPGRNLEVKGTTGTCTSTGSSACRGSSAPRYRSPASSPEGLPTSIERVDPAHRLSHARMQARKRPGPRPTVHRGARTRS